MPGRASRLARRIGMSRLVAARWCGMVVAALALCAAATGAGRASETEVREVAIEIDGKAAGQYLMTVTKQDDGVLSMQAQANITFKHVLGTYTCSFQGVEHWKEGRLLQLASKCNDDGKQTEVSAAADREILRVKDNGKERNDRWDVWTTRSWNQAN